MGILAVYDTTGIQSFIFATNKLRENVGASILIRKVLVDYLEETLKEVFNDIGANGSEHVIVDWTVRRGKPLEIASNPNIYAEIIYVGGGNAYIAYKDKETYVSATKIFLYKVYDYTVGIGIASAYTETDFTGGYNEQFHQLQINLANAKGKNNRPIPAGNQPITTASIQTGLPITCYKEYKIEGSDQPPEFEWMSAEQRLKCKARDDRYGENSIKNKEFSDLEYGNSFLAVIHLDGNSMGNAIQEYSKGGDWNEIVPRIREMSLRITQLYEKAYSHVLKRLSKHCNIENTDDLPHIKIIGEGDDITCVMAGQYGLSFAAELLRTIESSNNNDNIYPFPKWKEIRPGKNKPRISACAGVVIYHSHYPFSAAYKIAEECCSNAKRYTRNADKHTNGAVGSFIDFHLHQSGAIIDLNQLRREQYQAYETQNDSTKTERIYNRPYCVSDDAIFEGKYPKYSVFERIMQNWAMAHKYYQNNKNQWPRSRLKALRNAIPMGSNAVNDVINWCKSRGYILPDDYDQVSEIADILNFSQQNKSRYSQLFDVLEFADIYEDITK